MFIMQFLYTDSSIRGSLDWAKFRNIEIPILPLEIQEKTYCSISLVCCLFERI